MNQYSTHPPRARRRHEPVSLLPWPHPPHCLAGPYMCNGSQSCFPTGMVLRLMVPEACASMAASASGGNMDLRRLVAVAAAAEAGEEVVVEALDVAGVGLAPAILTGAAMATFGGLSVIGR